ncbi:hypothetical protein [Lignipirellula cremea]|uniref:hypothetical protein n=1 Tax=Lignipirellula cremea TaxID=2528010 RepID=UPI0011A6B68E|nr:hypothetical protein [Lignipirellula cremea]
MDLRKNLARDMLPCRPRLGVRFAKRTRSEEKVAQDGKVESRRNDGRNHHGEKDHTERLLESGENNFGDFSRLAGIGNATSTRVVANSFSHLFLLLCAFAPLREFPFSAMPIFQPAHFIFFQPLQERLAV